MSDTTTISRGAFARSWRALGGDDAAAVHTDLVRRYAAGDRGYHDLDHVAACLGWAADVREELSDAAAVEVALWFHDAVHGGDDDVGASADLFERTAGAAGIDAPAIARVRALIEATRHDGSNLAGDAAFVADIDLAILGSDPARFDRYEAGVRREYAHVDDATYRRARAAILRGFLERLAIYRTDRFSRRLEAQARENLERSIRKLARDE